MRLLIIIIALLLGATDDPSKKGRKGNESYRNEQHTEAAQLYREGIDAGTDAKPGILAGLWNNLGATLFRSGEFQQAKDAFTNAIGFARSNEEVSTFAYNAGNTIYSETTQGGSQGPPGALGMAPGMGQQAGGGGEGLQEALEYYKQALLADPTNEDAKYNYEFVKRQLDNQEQNEQDQEQENENQDQNQDQQNEEQQDQNQEQNQDQDQQNQDQQNQDEQQEQQQQNQEQQQNEEQQQQQQQQQQADPTKLSREEAERILQALQNEEQELLRQVMKPQTRPKKVDKDW